MTDFEPNLEPGTPPKIPLPQGWSDLVLLALLHVVALARIALLNARNWPDGSECDGLRLRADNDRLKSDYANHIWGIDLTLMPTDHGFWLPISPTLCHKNIPIAIMSSMSLTIFRGISWVLLSLRKIRLPTKWSLL